MKGFWVILCMLVAGPALAVPPPGAAERFLEGNQAYQDGDFARAAALYAQLLDDGLSAPELEYNLGNAYLKQGQLGLAILHLRRALAQRSNYESARLNLEYARSLTQDVKPDASGDSRMAWIGRLRLGPERAAALLLIVVTALCVVAALRLRVLRERTGASVLQAVLGGVTLLLCAALLFEWSQVSGRSEAVLVQPEVEIRSGPGTDYTVSFRLHDGTEVDVLRESSGWFEIRVSEKLQGWAPGEALAAL